MTKTIYIAGPITGISNFAAPFDAGAARLRALGWTVENPCHNPPPSGTEPDHSEAAWSHYLRLGLMQMLRCDAIAVLDGWWRSRGARLELEIAMTLGMKTYLLYPYEENDDDVLEEAE